MYLMQKNLPLSEEVLFKIALSVEKTLILNSDSTNYADILLYNEIFNKPYDKYYYIWYTNGNLLISAGAYKGEGASIRTINEESFEKFKKESGAAFFTFLYSDVYAVFGNSIYEFRMSPKDDTLLYEIRGVLAGDKIDDIRKFLSKIEFDTHAHEEEYGLTINSDDYIYTRFFKKPKESFTVDISKSYNDDLPYNEIIEILGRKKNDLIFFYGLPGTGKTTLIKKLMTEVDKKFVLFDPEIFSSLSSRKLVEYLDENRDCIFVLEDCEKLLKSREDGFNPAMASVLNLTDGIIGELMNIKFLCTFNCPISEVDNALLRKGRLSLKYEFKELSLEKTRLIYPEASAPMTLADAYNAKSENDFSRTAKKQIGFGQ